MGDAMRPERRLVGMHRSEAVRARVCGMVGWAILPLFFSVLVLASRAQAKDQLTVESLLIKSAPGATAEKFPEVQQAIERFGERNAKAALEMLQDAKKKHPEIPPPEMMLADMWLAENQPRPAHSALEECVKNHADDPEAYLVLADMAFSEQRITEADLLFERAAQLAAGFKENALRASDCRARAEAGLAAIAERREQWNSAKKHLQEWLAIVEPAGKPAAGGPPNTPAANAHERLGQVVFKADPNPMKTDGARAAYEQFQQAVADDNKSASADMALAELYEDAGLHERAKNAVTSAVAHLPQDPETKIETLLTASRWAIATQQADNGLQYAKQAFNLDPKSKRALEAKYFMGVAARIQGDARAAEQAFGDILNASPDNFLASNQLAQVLAEQKNDPDKQQRALKIAAENEAAQSKPDAAHDPARVIESAATLGWVLFLTDRFSQADQVFEEIAKTGVASPDLLYYRGRLYQQQGQTNDAIASFKAALANKRGLFIHRQDAQDRLAKLK